MSRSRHPSVEDLEGRRLLAVVPLGLSLPPRIRAEVAAPSHGRPPAQPRRLERQIFKAIQSSRPSRAGLKALLDSPPSRAAQPHWDAGTILAAPIFAVAGLFHKGI
jgi:hypothetical protein